MVGWLVLAKRLTECWLAVGWWVARCFLLQNSAYKTEGFFLAVGWLHGWRLPSLLSWSVVGWLVLAKRLTECWLTVGWWVARCFFTAKLRLKDWCFFFEQLTDCMAGGSPLCLAGRWSVDWFKQRDWQNIGWLLVGGWLSVFLLQNSDYKPDGFFLAVDWLHGWRLPSLLSWLVVDELVLAKRLTECWLVGGSVFFYCKIQTIKLTVFFFWAVDWLHGWRLPSLLSWSVVGWLVLAKRLTECWLAVDWWVARCFLLQNGD